MNKNNIIDKIKSIGIIVIILIGAILLFNKIFSSSDLTAIQNIKPFNNCETLKESIDSSSINSRWTLQNSKETVYNLTKSYSTIQCTATINTVNNTKEDLNVSIKIDTTDSKDKYISSIITTIDSNSSYNEVDLLYILYSKSINKNITKDSVSKLLRRDVSNDEYKKLISQSQVFNSNEKSKIINDIDNPYSQPTSSVVTNTTPAKTKSSIDLKKYSVTLSDANKINNPQGVVLLTKTNIHYDMNDYQILKDFKNVQYKGRSMIDILSIMDNLQVSMGGKEALDVFYIFAEGNLNGTPLSLRFKYDTSLYLMDSDINNDEVTRVSGTKLKELIFDNNNA